MLHIFFLVDKTITTSCGECSVPGGVANGDNVPELAIFTANGSNSSTSKDEHYSTVVREDTERVDATNMDVESGSESHVIGKSVSNLPQTEVITIFVEC